MTKLKKKYNDDISQKNARIKELEAERRNLQDDFDKLFDTKISLERELTVYRNLLELDEGRFKFLRDSKISAVTLTAKAHYSISSGNNIVIAQHGQEYISVFNISDKVCFNFQF